MNQTESVSEPMIFAIVSEADTRENQISELIEIGLAVQDNSKASAVYYAPKSAIELIQMGVPGIDQKVWKRVKVIPVESTDQALILLQKALRGPIYNYHLTLFPGIGISIQELKTNFHVRVVRPPQARFGEGILDAPNVQILQIISSVGNAEARKDPILARGLFRIQLHSARFFPSEGDITATLLRRGLDGFLVAVEGINAYGVPTTVFFLVKQLEQVQEIALRIARAA